MVLLHFRHCYYTSETNTALQTLLRHKRHCLCTAGKVRQLLTYSPLHWSKRRVPEESEPPPPDPIGSKDEEDSPENKIQNMTESLFNPGLLITNLGLYSKHLVSSKLTAGPKKLECYITLECDITLKGLPGTNTLAEAYPSEAPFRCSTLG